MVFLRSLSLNGFLVDNTACLCIDAKYDIQIYRNNMKKKIGVTTSSHTVVKLVTRRSKGEPVFGRTPFGSKKGPISTRGFEPPRVKWDRPPEE